MTLKRRPASVVALALVLHARGEVLPEPHDPLLACVVGTPIGQCPWYENWPVELLLRDAIRTLPEPRREALALGAHPHRWLPRGACTTPAVLARCVRLVAEEPGWREMFWAHLRETTFVTFRAFGGAAAAPLRQLIADRQLHHRSVFISLLEGCCDRETVASLLDVLEQKKHPLVKKSDEQLAHHAALRLLHQCDPAEVLAEIEARLGSTKEPRRTTAAALLARMIPTAQTRRVASGALAGSKRGEAAYFWLSRALRGSDAPAGLGAYRARRAAVPEADRERAMRALIESHGDWKAQLSPGPALIPLVAGWASYCCVASASYNTDTSSVMEALVREFPGDDALPWALTEYLVAVLCGGGSYPLPSAITRAVEQLGPTGVEAVAWAARMHHGPGNVEMLLDWLSMRRPRDGEVFVRGLSGPAPALLRLAQRGLCAMDERALPLLCEAFDQGTEGVRAAVASVWERLALPASLPAVVARRQGTTPAVDQAMQRAIDRIDLVIAAQQTRTVEDEQRLEARLLPDPGVRFPSFVKVDGLPELRWRSGAPLQDPARRWLVGELMRWRDEDHVVRAVVARVRREDRPGWLEALWVAAGLRRVNQGFWFRQKREWCIQATATLGEPEHLLLFMLPSNPYRQDDQVILRILLHHDSPDAIRLLREERSYFDRYSPTFRAVLDGCDVGAGRDRVARRRGVGTEEIFTTTAPACGFDPAGYRPWRHEGQDARLRLVLAAGRLERRMDLLGTTPPRPARVSQATAALRKEREKAFDILLEWAQNACRSLLDEAAQSGRIWPVSRWLAALAESAPLRLCAEGHAAQIRRGPEAPWEAGHLVGGSLQPDAGDPPAAHHEMRLAP